MILTTGKTFSWSTKMKYHPSRKSFPFNKKIVGIILVLFVFLVASFISSVRDILITSYSYSAWFARQFTVELIHRVINPWESVNIENATTTVAQAEINLLRKENEDLKTMLGRQPSEKTILARVLVKPPQTPYDEVVIDVGQSLGVSEGAQLYDETGALVGTVTSTSNSFSKAKLFSSPGIITEGELLKEGIVLSLLGQGDGSFTAKVPREFNVKEGDIFILSGLKSRPLAEVIKIQSDAEDSFKIIFAKGFFEPRSLTWVFVEL